MSEQDLKKIENFMKWLNQHTEHASVMVHHVDREYLGEGYIVEANRLDTGGYYLSAKPKDVRLKGLTVFIEEHHATA